MSRLDEYYQLRRLTDSAFKRYLQFADASGWDIGGQHGKLHLYALASHAFDSGTPRPDAFKAFHDMYETLRNWPGMKRGGRLALADEVFNALLRDGSSFFYGTKVSLANITFPSSEANDVETFLPLLDFVKTTQSYPWMPVSKVLHFANPSLFPMWDWEAVWSKVMRGAFDTEYQTFCHKNGFRVSENGAKFVLNYTLWAAHYIQQSNSDFMKWFVDWMERNFSADIARYSIGQRLSTFYATAFEFVAIGVAYLELGI